jgi:hypothetical protein
MPTVTPTIAQSANTRVIAKSARSGASDFTEMDVLLYGPYSSFETGDFLGEKMGSLPLV